MNKQCCLVLTNVNKSYRQGSTIVEVLKNVNFSVASGELVAIIGASGSGKSTLLHIAGLLDRPDSGAIQMAQETYSYNMIGDGTIVPTSNSFESIRLSYLGFVYQYHHLLSNFTARENIALPALLAGNSYTQALTIADKLLEILGLSDRKHHLPGELSGGEQQRVAIARGLVNKPKIVLADEPTGNLDPSTANDVFNIFIALAASQNTSVIMVTHNHSLAQNMHKVLQLKNGILALA